ncbi:MAG: queuosine salvage family protein [Anaerolineae bacterium]
MSDSLGVLETCRFVAERSENVCIDRGAVERFCGELVGWGIEVPAWDFRHHFFDGSERTVNYLLVLDGLNFCFWVEPRWEIEYEGERLRGYFALAASLKRAVEEGFPILDTEHLQRISLSELRHIFRGWGEIPLLEERLRILREMGEVLSEQYGGRACSLVEDAGKRAVALVRRLVEDFPSFRDEASYRGRLVRFYKRAQIFVADLYWSFGGKGWGDLAGMEELTVFADYKLPQLLREAGVLRYSPELARKVDERVLLPAGGQEEVEIRANTVWAAELIRRSLVGMGVSLRAFELDCILWHISKREGFRARPHHRVLTTFY